MIRYMKNVTNELFRKGVRKGDILWFIHNNVKNTSQNCIYFTISFILIIFCTVEVGCQLYLLTEKPTLGQLLNFAPMFVTSFHVIFTAGPLMFQRYRYLAIYEEYFGLWPIKSTDNEGLIEIFELFRKGLATFVFYVVIGLSSDLGYLPWTGVDYENTAFAPIAALKLIENELKSLRYCVAFINFALLFGKGYYMCLYGMHLMHLCVLYTLQSILLRRRIKGIGYTKEGVSPLLLADNKQYQDYVHRELSDCIKLDVKLKKFSSHIIDHFKWVLLVHFPTAICLFSMLYYQILFFGGPCPLGSKFYVVAGNSMAFIYAFYSEMFREQTELIRNALLETPWYTFNTSNRKTVLIFANNLERPKFISLGGLFDLNYGIVIFVMHKVFNVLTVLSQMTPESSMAKN